MTEEDLVAVTEYAYEEAASLCEKMDIQTFGKIFLPILYALVFTIGLVGNFLVILTIVKGGRQNSITDIFLLNLAISDVLFVVSLPFWASYIVRGWTLGNLSCQIVSSFYSVGLFGGMFFITVISFDRYLAIVCATCLMKTRTIRCGYLVSLVIWAMAILFAAPQFVFIRKSESECTSLYPEHLQDIWPIVIYAENNIIGFLLPLCIMTFCYLMIIKTLISCKNHRKKRAIKLILLVVIVFFLFWTPYHISLFLQILRFYDFFQNCSSLRLLDYTMQVTESLAFSHCCLNPIIYAFAGEKFRKKLAHLVLKCLSFICFCGHSIEYCSRAPTPIPETSNQTQNTSDQDGSILL
ncbi:CX3C chemokine receptor 1 [Rhineura floridana]|uniref:CX3C chemokine receptor 1 n=1 Tax=Rhineura floridana TaxID=261503 RepID=UPI002AC822DB|nr:CX3C chemokine receptor 1 [Rhineura floridana]XP_061442115.1 CX3C chemokine receptor 1 [Rhineura floridana]XP_061442116.1 CX3C chemokine receptor 1 [Rhineura floridana]XP_061442117.1 CX3C chemokine receptor 1 [Rhineura floridana]XP_061442118.1 CX3C chemokine receptor 1 [Rhineura floridana]XP_061442119.1 CX3C chemokine receptor 1 [Rhineura floridana]